MSDTPAAPLFSAGETLTNQHDGHAQTTRNDRPYGDWNITAQGVPFLADLQSPATLEVLLYLTQGAGNPASVAS